jgi:hypothetical protein
VVFGVAHLDGGATCRHRRLVSAGELFGEIAFFTEVPQLECIKAGTVVRILTISRPAYNATAAAFPLGSRSVLENLRVKAQQVGLPRPMPVWFRYAACRSVRPDSTCLCIARHGLSMCHLMI